MASSSPARSRRASAAASSAPPPRSLNVQKFAESRAAELEALHAVVAGRTGGSFRLHRSKRRRTTSHVGRTARGRGGGKRRRLGQGEAQAERQEGEGEEEEKKKKLPRRVRRRIELRKNMESGFSVSGDGTERLRTHLWHAKRFTMAKRWGFYLPLGLHGRGRGSRAVLKRLNSGALLHDSSYCCPIQLEGPEDSLLAVLRMVLVPLSSDVLAGISQPVICGMCYASAMELWHLIQLHHIGAPLSPLIAPVIYMWRPVSKDHANVNVVLSDSGGKLSALYRQLWIWVHAAAFSEGFDVLSTACQKQMNEDGVFLHCSSLKGKLAKLEIMGSEATQILQKIVHPASESFNACEDSSYEGDSCLVACSSQNRKSILCEQADPLPSHENMKDCSSSLFNKSMLLRQAGHLPSHAILSLNVLDPRNLLSKRGVEPLFLAPSADPQCDLLKDISKESNASACVSPQNFSRETMMSFWSKPEEYGTFVSDSNDLWVSHDRLQPPIEESILCLEKHHKRLKYFYLNNTNSVTLTRESQGCSSRTCSVLLLKHNYQMKSQQGWSIILPLSWVKSFWIPLVCHGAYAIGLRERHWVASDGGIPCFPFDFPDCKAYSMFMSVVAGETNQIAELRPLSMRPSRIPMPPPWDCVRSSVEDGHSITGSSQSVEKQQQCGDSGEELALSTLVDSHMETCRFDTRKNTGLPFEGSIARTSHVLSYCLKSIHGSHLLLFPNAKMGKRAFSELINKERINWVPRSINKLSPDRPLYFSRVLLHPYREGVFDEGAVVCAPVVTDLLLLASRSEEPGKLQIPHSLATSYFTQNDSGRWVLQVPEDHSTRQSYRWPIGFVTSGFVQGSTNPVALAMCEVTLLAELREQQWSEMQQKGRPEIFVLVRNIRSTAYRLSRATIVLEQEDDVEFM